MRGTNFVLRGLSPVCVCAHTQAEKLLVLVQQVSVLCYDAVMLEVRMRMPPDLSLVS